jgi:hypothetical protein
MPQVALWSVAQVRQSGGVLLLALKMSQSVIDDLLVLDARDHFGSLHSVRGPSCRN